MKLELKVCEGCGGLWLRPQGLRWKYCAKCAIKLRDLPQRGTKQPSNPRLPTNRANDQRPTTDDREEVLA